MYFLWIEIQQKGGNPMTDKLLTNLCELNTSIGENFNSVQEALVGSGDRAIMASAAKYHKALELLSDE